MAYIEIFPKSAAAQQRLTDSSNAVMDLIQDTTKAVLNVPDHDIIVELNQCSALAFNSSAMRAASVPDVLVKISTSDLDLRPAFQDLCDRLVSNWDAHFTDTFKVEVWVSSIDAWGCNMSFD